MTCRTPVPPLSPLIESWPTEQLIQRLCRADRAPALFHPGLDGSGQGCKPSRFAPIRDKDGKVVPYLYGGSSLDCAIFETVFHEVPVEAPDKYVDLDAFASHAHVEIVARRDLRLVNLTTVGLHRLRVPKEELLESAALDYPATAKWAEAIHHQFPLVDGMFWMSRKFDSGQALVLFGDRLGDDLKGTCISGALRTDDKLRQAIVRLALRAGIEVS